MACPRGGLHPPFQPRWQLARRVIHSESVSYHLLVDGVDRPALRKPDGCSSNVNPIAAKFAVAARHGELRQSTGQAFLAPDARPVPCLVKGAPAGRSFVSVAVRTGRQLLPAAVRYVSLLRSEILAVRSLSARRRNPGTRHEGSNVSPGHNPHLRRRRKRAWTGCSLREQIRPRMPLSLAIYMSTKQGPDIGREFRVTSSAKV